jgi:dTDP-4-amino-4,6-dideoxygalactose transaminase
LIVVHVFGHAAEISKLKKLSKDFHIPIVEDAAEAIGSYYNNKHLGTFGEMGVISFNGNKTITTGGGGILLTNNKTLALKAKHLTTTAKIPHKWEYIFKETGYNFRMPNINAALGLAQIKKLKIILSNKKRVYKIYKDYFSQIEGVNLMSQPKKCNSNFWLQTLILDKNFSKYKRLILKETNKKNVGTRPCWKPLHKLKHLQNFPRMDMSIANEIYKRIINIPSSSHLKMKKK